jgi:hypothetical protein
MIAWFGCANANFCELGSDRVSVGGNPPSMMMRKLTTNKTKKKEEVIIINETGKLAKQMRFSQKWRSFTRRFSQIWL